MKKMIATMLVVGMLPMTTSALAEDAPAESSQAETYLAADVQKLDASYTLALNAINAEDYETAKEYLNVCFAYSDPHTDPVMYADLLLKRACIDVIEEKYDMALLNLDAALRVQPDLADAYLVCTQVYSTQGNIDAAIENLEKYIELSGDTALYETVAQLQEANGNLAAAQEAYDKFVEGAGSEIEEAGFQSGLYKMQAGLLEEAVADFEAYVDDEDYGAGAMYNIGLCRMNLGDFAGGVEAFNACEEKGGAFEGIYYNRGVCALMNNDWENAAADFVKSLESEPYVEDARFNLGVCQMQQGDYEAAVASFTELIGDGEQAGEEETGEQAEAVVNGGAYYYRAVCNAALGNLEEAIKDYTTCIDLGYELAQSYYQRAQVYAAMGDSENQNSDLKKSLQLSK